MYLWSLHFNNLITPGLPRYFTSKLSDFLSLFPGGQLDLSSSVFKENCLHFQWPFPHPGDFPMKVKQINSQSDLIWMSSFVVPSYLTIRSSVYIIFIWDPFILNLYNFWQTRCIYIRRKPRQCGLLFNEQITRTHFFLSQPSIRPVPDQVILLWKGPPKLFIEYQLVPLWAFPPKSPGYFSL